MKARELDKAACIILSLAFMAWSGLFIYHSSYIALDGHRYFSLFDDAMISMRYAWNFAHGQGLVWNAGERVEGYTNLLMTLVMSLAAFIFDKKFAVLAVQILGIPTILLTALPTKRIATGINEGRPYREMIGVLAFACVLFYYPLNYWTLMGMETGLLTLLLMATIFFALRWLRSNKDADLFGISIMAGLAFLTRNDSLIASALVFAYAAWEAYRNKKGRPTFLKILCAGSLFLLFPVAQTIFRYFYYGALLPNTYTLKLANFPLSIRLIGGANFVSVFLQQSWLPLVLAVLGFLLNRQRVKLFLFTLMIAAIAYQVYVGGDPWPSWRMLAPAMPALFILAFSAVAEFIGRLRLFASRRYAAGFLILLLSLLALAFTDLPFRDDIAVRGPTSAAIANRVNTNTAIAIDAMTDPNASVGVIWAGTLPYYVDRRSVDFLGKSDAYIAHLNADVSGAVSWGGMISVPGHNKYDLEYSIVKLQPTYIGAFSWGNQTVKPWVTKNYMRVEYHGAQGVKTIFLRKDSPDVCWEACQDEYKIIPWPKQPQETP